MKSNEITKPNANTIGANCVSPQTSRGITLVALIITIIIMLLLLGASITIAINGGLFDVAKRAAKGTEEAKRKEQELASGRVKIDGIWYDSLEDYAIGKASEIQQPEDLNESNTKFKYTPEGWTNGEVKVAIDASSVGTGFILKYSSNGINWNNYDTEITMNTNGSIFAKLVDSEGNEGGAVTANVRNIDKTAPTINTGLSGEEATDTAIPLNINVTDSISGISKIEWHYKLSTEDSYEKQTDTYVEMLGKEAGEKQAVTKETTLIGLTPSSTYNIYAEVYDVAGNVSRSPETGTISVTTKKEVVKPQVGDYINYEPDAVTNNYELLGKYSGCGAYNTNVKPFTLINPIDQSISQEKLDWQILKIHEDGSMDLIGTPTSNYVELGGALGYNNGVYLLHDICKELYSKKSAGIEARSVSLEDFEDEDNGGNWKSVRDAYIDGTVQYGKTKTFTDANYIYYPNLYAQENGSGIDKTTGRTDGIGAAEKGYTSLTEETCSKASSRLTVTQKAYTATANEENYGKSAKVLDASSTNNYSWVASRCARIYEDKTMFELYTTWTGITTGSSIFESNRYSTFVPM